jgi:hypothetical protein
MRKLIVVSLVIFWAMFTQKVQSQPEGNSGNFRNNNQKTEISGSNTSQPYPDDIWKKHLIINSDSRVDTLIQIHREENIRKGGIDGYRVQIFQGAKDAADQIEAKFRSTYENIFVDTYFPSPFFVVKAGGFRTKSEAIKLKYFIKNEYPAAYIIEDVIKLSELGENGDGI